MGLPSVNVSFTEKSVTAIKRGERGIVCLLMKDSEVTEKAIYTCLSVADIPSELSESNREQIALALMGYVNAPRKVIVCIANETDQNYTNALEELENIKFDYLVVPTATTEGVTQAVVSWIKAQRQQGKKCKAVLSNVSADTEGVINLTTEFTVNDKVYTSEQYCARIAGIIAGTPLTISCTYAPLMEVTDCTRLTKAKMDEAIDKGQFIAFHDGEKVKVGRGVNSLISTTQDKGDSFKKIKIVEAMDMIHDDIVKTAQDSYLGKFANSYDNKCLLIAAIGGYFDGLMNDGILAEASIGIDMEATKVFLKSTGINIETMSDDDIKQADTKDKVFLSATVKILDAIEEIELPITI